MRRETLRDGSCNARTRPLAAARGALFDLERPATSLREPRRHATGFTILELALALLVLTVIAALSIPAYFSRAEVSLENAARLLVDDLRLAQARAYHDRIGIEIHFLEEGGGYRIVQAGTEAVLEDFEPRQFNTGAVFEGVRIEAVISAKPGLIELDEHGMPRASAKVTLELDGERRVVDIDAELGLVRLDEAAAR